jgi:DNA-binding CsgD family transcriptional regulator
MDMEDDSSTEGGGERRFVWGVAGAFLAVAGLAGLDVAADVKEGGMSPHLVVELLLFLCGASGLAWGALRLVQLGRQARALGRRLGESQQQAEAWRQEAKGLAGGLSLAIDRQLERWSLSPAEKEVALLLLKGLAHKDIAEVRHISEATARQQARAVYKKAQLTGRSDLAAFFLEDLLQPPGPPAP